MNAIYIDYVMRKTSFFECLQTSGKKGLIVEQTIHKIPGCVKTAKFSSFFMNIPQKKIIQKNWETASKDKHVREQSILLETWRI